MSGLQSQEVFGNWNVLGCAEIYHQLFLETFITYIIVISFLLTKSRKCFAMDPGN